MFRRNKIKMLPNFGGTKKPIISETSQILPEEKCIPSVTENISINKLTENISEINKELPPNKFNDLPQFDNALENNDIKICKPEENNMKENILCTNVIPTKLENSFEPDENILCTNVISPQRCKSETDEKNLKTNTLKENICVPNNNNIINKVPNNIINIGNKVPNIANSLEKTTARRTRIKGQPNIPSIKRPPSISVKQENNNNNNNSNIKDIFLHNVNSSSEVRKNSIPINNTIKNESNVKTVLNNINSSTLDSSNEAENSINPSNISESAIHTGDILGKDVNTNKSKAVQSEFKSTIILNNNFNSDNHMEDRKNKESVETMLEEKVFKNLKSKSSSTNKRSLLEIGKQPTKKFMKSVLSDKETEELSKGKKSFLERKQKYRNKLSTGSLERNEMTMFDLIFWNPASNPMPGSQSNEQASNRSRDNTVDESTVSVTVEEQNVEEEGLQIPSETDKDNSKIVDNANNDEDENGAKPLDTQQEPEPTPDPDSDEETSSLAPQVKIGPNGELIVDEKSLVIQTTAAKNRDKVMSTAEVIEESNDTSHYGKWSKRRKRSTEWTRKETARFYKALSTVGTDFSLMETIFAWRTRQELKIKFKKEEKNNRHLIDTALNDCTQFDFSIFDESDYDPEEDRKESKEAEKAEAKKKKELDREQRKLEKEREKKLKKEQEKLEKVRKKKLKSIYKKRKRRKCNGAKKEIVPRIIRKRNNSAVSIETQEVVCEVIFSVDKQVENNYTVKEDGNAPLVKQAYSEDSREASLVGQTCSEDNREASLVEQTYSKDSREASLVEQTYSEDNREASLVEQTYSKDSREASLVEQTYSEDNSEASLVEQTYSEDNRETPLMEQTYSDGNREASHVKQTYSEDNREEENLSDDPLDLGVDDDPLSLSVVGVGEEEGIVLSQDQLYAQIVDVGENEVVTILHSPILKEEESQGSTIEDRFMDLDEEATSLHGPVNPIIGDLRPATSQIPSIVNVQKSSEGQQFIAISTANGPKNIPVPPYATQTSNIVVMATTDPENPSEQIYHVYTVAPVAQNCSPSETREIDSDKES